MTAPIRLNERATIQQRPAEKDGYGRKVANTAPWDDVAVNIWCEVQDTLPSRGESSANGVRKAARQSRLRLRCQILIAADMRVILHSRGDRITQVISGPALLDDKIHNECMLEEITHG